LTCRVGRSNGAGVGLIELILALLLVLRMRTDTKKFPNAPLREEDCG
jgi:hypothetical protein